MISEKNSNSENQPERIEDKVKELKVLEVLSRICESEIKAAKKHGLYEIIPDLEVEKAEAEKAYRKAVKEQEYH